MTSQPNMTVKVKPFQPEGKAGRSALGGLRAEAKRSEANIGFAAPSVDLMEVLGRLRMISPVMRSLIVLLARRPAPQAHLDDGKGELARLSDILDMAASLHKRLMHDLDIEQACDSHPWLRRHALQVCSEVLAQCLLDTPDPTQALEASQKLLGPILIAAIKSMTASLGISGKKEPYDIDDAVSANLTLLECAAKVHKQVSQHSFFHDVDRLCTETITQIVRTAKLLGDKLAPAGAPARSRLALSQGLVRTVTDVYTACHFEFATIELRRLNALNETERKAYIDRHPNGVPLTDLWRQVNTRAGILVGCIRKVQPELLPLPEPGLPAD